MPDLQEDLQELFCQAIIATNQINPLSPAEGTNPDLEARIMTDAVVDTVAGRTSVLLTFLPGTSVTSHGSLVDGNYRLVVNGNRVVGGGLCMDGDGDVDGQD